jgi:hypothetical protein
MVASKPSKFVISVISLLFLRNSISFPISSLTKTSFMSLLRLLASSEDQTNCVLEHHKVIGCNYTAPVHSPSFLIHLEAIRNERGNDHPLMILV